MGYFESILLCNLIHVFPNEYLPLVNSDSVSKSKSIDDLLLNEFDQCFLIDQLITNSFNYT